MHSSYSFLFESFLFKLLFSEIKHLKVYLCYSLAVCHKEGHHAAYIFRRQIWDATAPEHLHVKCVQALGASWESSLTHLARLEPELLFTASHHTDVVHRGGLDREQNTLLKNWHCVVTTFKKSTKASETTQRPGFPGPLWAFSEDRNI